MFLTGLARAVDVLKSALIWRRSVAAEPVAPTSYWTAERVEAAIDEAGRAEVFAEARRLGWADGYAPLWVWAQIASVVRQHRLKRETQEAHAAAMLEYYQYAASLEQRMLH